MTTARERYEAKTRVVTFRVSQKEYQQLEEVKAKTGQSNADLIILGAGIAREKRKAKLTEASELENRLAQLKAAIRETQRQVDRTLAEEKERRMNELNREMEAFRLFDQGWTLEAAGFELGVDINTVYCYFQSWGEARDNKQAVERELLRACLKERLNDIKITRYDPSSRRMSTEKLEALAKEEATCHRLLAAPDSINQEWRAYLLAEYSSQVLAWQAWQKAQQERGLRR